MQILPSRHELLFSVDSIDPNRSAGLAIRTLIRCRTKLLRPQCGPHERHGPAAIYREPSGQSALRGRHREAIRRRRAWRSGCKSDSQVKSMRPTATSNPGGTESRCSVQVAGTVQRVIRQVSSVSRLLARCSTAPTASRRTRGRYRSSGVLFPKRYTGTRRPACHQRTHRSSRPRRYSR